MYIYVISFQIQQVVQKGSHTRAFESHTRINTPLFTYDIHGFSIFNLTILSITYTNTVYFNQFQFYITLYYLRRNGTIKRRCTKVSKCRSIIKNARCKTRSQSSFLVRLIISFLTLSKHNRAALSKYSLAQLTLQKCPIFQSSHDNKYLQEASAGRLKLLALNFPKTRFRHTNVYVRFSLTLCISMRPFRMMYKPRSGTNGTLETGKVIISL